MYVVCRKLKLPRGRDALEVFSSSMFEEEKCSSTGFYSFLRVNSKKLTSNFLSKRILKELDECGRC